MKRNLFIFFLFLAVLYFFAVFDTRFSGPDEPLYFAYTASVAQDGDLNIVNQIDYQKYPFYFPSGELLVSSTFNFPDYHNHGGVVLWLPFYMYGEWVYSLAEKLSLLKPYLVLDEFIKCVISFSTVMFGLLTIMLTFLFCRRFFPSKDIILSTAVMFLGTPFFYFLLCETGNAQMIAALFSMLSIWFCSYAVKMRRPHWLLYGLFFSMCVIIKIDIWFQIFFIALFFIALAVLKKISWSNGGYFLIGIVLGLCIKQVNDYIKYGTSHIGELGLLNYRTSYFFEQLFSSYRGFFYTSPVFYICAAGFILLIRDFIKEMKSSSDKRIETVFIFTLSLYLFIKIFILSFRYAWGGGTPGARILLTEYPIFVILYSYLFQRQKNLRQKFIFFGISVLCVFWNMLIIAEFVGKVDLGYMVHAPAWHIRINMLKNLGQPLFYMKALYLKLWCIPLLIFLAGIIFYAVRHKSFIHNPWDEYPAVSGRYKTFKILALFTAYLYFAYGSITILNLRNNRKNAAIMKDAGFFDNARVVDSRNFERLENSGSMDEMIEYYRLKGDENRVSAIKRVKKELYNN